MHSIRRARPHMRRLRRRIFAAAAAGVWRRRRARVRVKLFSRARNRAQIARNFGTPSRDKGAESRGVDIPPETHGIGSSHRALDWIAKRRGEKSSWYQNLSEFHFAKVRNRIAAHVRDVLRFDNDRRRIFRHGALDK